ncbi:MAG TPA: ABC transporter permease [Candidatus Caccovicinus merdipullorum]|uniref:Cell division protein FtsX n=1 Tax=Candidatus Caccovicinus merdipullorum TaxID=2840724 RepID=A0A9D1GML5_9FIRM|nr:ABC transporter permease [Candidatus Caccovicinus merdipullorum]
MRISTFIYCLKQGLINIRRNLLHSLASTATISACIFLFCLFFAIIGNVRHFAMEAETTVGITVFFDESLSEDEILAIGDQIQVRSEVAEMNYISAQEAWESFKTEYFGDMEELAEGFAEDNPLAGSASFEIFLKDISLQDQMVEYLNSIEGVRKVNYSNAAAAGLNSLNRIIGAVSAVIIGVLLAVAVFLISNTISVAAAFRKQENEIMKLIGATNYMIRAPFVVEGLLIGLVGAAIPLAAVFFLYRETADYVTAHYVIMTGIFTPVPIQEMMPVMTAVALALGGGIGFFGSFFTIRKHLRV